MTYFCPLSDFKSPLTSGLVYNNWMCRKDDCLTWKSCAAWLFSLPPRSSDTPTSSERHRQESVVFVSNTSKTSKTCTFPVLVFSCIYFSPKSSVQKSHSFLLFTITANNSKVLAAQTPKSSYRYRRRHHRNTRPFPASLALPWWLFCHKHLEQPFRESRYWAPTVSQSDIATTVVSVKE